MNLTKKSKTLNQSLESIKSFEAELEMEAYAIVDNFNRERKDLKLAAEEAATSRNGKPKIWCGLNLSVRNLNASIQITWYLLHINSRTKKKQFMSIPKGAGDAFDLRRLKPHANAFEWDLVKETERKAAKVRATWKRVVEARNQLRYIYQSLDDE